MKRTSFSLTKNCCDWLKNGLDNNYLVHLIREEIQRLDKKTVTIQWIPSHVGIDGNEDADDLANRACHLEEISLLKISFSDAYCFIKDLMLQDWQDRYQWDSQFKGQKHYQVMNEVSSRAWFSKLPFNGNEIRSLVRIRTGHGLCGRFKYLFNMIDNPRCSVCNVFEDLNT